MKPEEISVTYPNKFIQLEEKRIYVYNTLFNLPEIYLIAAIIDYFAKHPEYKETKVCTQNTFTCKPGVYIFLKNIPLVVF